jgi:hypothetical protein
MKVQYIGNGYTLNYGGTYEVVDANSYEYKIRNDNGKLAWYSKTNFIEVKDKVSVSTSATNTISSDLVNKIEKELKDTEQRVADLRKQLEDAYESLKHENAELKCSNRRLYYLLDEIMNDIQCEHGFDSAVYAKLKEFFDE